MFMNSQRGQGSFASGALRLEVLLGQEQAKQYQRVPGTEVFY